MKNDKILRAIGNIDDDLINRAGSVTLHPKASADAGRKFRWLKWALPAAACIIIAVAVTMPMLLKQFPQAGGGQIAGAGNTEIGGGSVAPAGGNGGTLTGSVPGGGLLPSPGLSLDSDGVMSEACYAALEDWRGLPTENYVLEEKTDGYASDRRVPWTLDDLAAYADAFIVVAGVHETAQDGENMQTSIVEYAETIGNRLNTKKWDDYTVSTGSRILIRQRLIGGCTMDEPNNLLREGGVYLLPVTFNPDWGAYEVVGDLDVLFELNDEGKIVSHSQWEGFNKYDGKSLSELADDVRALYPVFDADFTEQPIETAEQAEVQVGIAYRASGFRNFSVEYVSETAIGGADVYLFKVYFGGKDAEHAAIAKENGAFIRGELHSDGDMQTFGGLGAFPWNR